MHDTDASDHVYTNKHCYSVHVFLPNEIMFTGGFKEQCPPTSDSKLLKFR